MAAREDAFARIQALAKQYGTHLQSLSDANEAQTRLSVIDGVLAALGWSHADLAVEQRVATDSYTDYLLRVDGIPRLIVEAKRVGHTFKRTKKAKQHEYTVSYLESAFALPFRETIAQARRYSTQTGVPYALITNGLEWVLLDLHPVPGVDFRQQKAAYFGDIINGEGSFDYLWELVSRDAVATASLEEHFASLNVVNSEIAIAPRASLGDLRWRPAPADVYRDSFYGLFFNEIIDAGRRRMLEYCFVTDSKLDQYEGDLKRALADTAPAFLGDAQELQPGEQSRVLENYTGDKRGRVVLVVGSVGAGKSTFVTKVMVNDGVPTEHRYLLVDMINEGVTEEPPPEATLWRMLYEAWKDEHPEAAHFKELKATFHKEVDELRDGGRAPEFKKAPEELEKATGELLTKLSGDPEIFVRRSLRHFRHHHRQSIVVFLDNVDRASERYQRLVYNFAHKVAMETGITVIVTMRESTFFRGKENGFLDVRSSDVVFHLQAPDLTKLISRRVKYVETQLEKDYRVSEWRRRPDWLAFKAAMLNAAGQLKQSLLTDTGGRDLIGLLGSAAWHNVRAFLEYLRRVDSLLIGADSWSADLVAAALSLPTETDSQTPVPSSVFTPSNPAAPAHFLRIRIALFLHFGVPSREGKRGVPASRVEHFARVYGYRSTWIRDSIQALVRERIVECLEIPSEADVAIGYEFSGVHSFRLSPLGLLMIERLIAEPALLLACAWNLPFHDSAHLGEFVKAIRTICDEQGLAAGVDHEALRLLIETPALMHLKTYLGEALELELLRTSELTKIAEIGATETRLKTLLERCGIKPAASRAAPRRAEQPSLFADSAADAEDASMRLIAIPPNAREAKIEQSYVAARILWALVAATVIGKTPISGAEVTRMINAHLLDADQRLEPTNVSRSLRSAKLKASPWIARRSDGARELFLLGTGWRDVWRAAFDCEPPAIAE